jgi:hypothetical protein
LLLQCGHLAGWPIEEIKSIKKRVSTTESSFVLMRTPRIFDRPTKSRQRRVENGKASQKHKCRKVTRRNFFSGILATLEKEEREASR